MTTSKRFYSLMAVFSVLRGTALVTSADSSVIPQLLVYGAIVGATLAYSMYK